MSLSQWFRWSQIRPYLNTLCLYLYVTILIVNQKQRCQTCRTQNSPTGGSIYLEPCNGFAARLYSPTLCFLLPVQSGVKHRCASVCGLLRGLTLLNSAWSNSFNRIGQLTPTEGKWPEWPDCCTQPNRITSELHWLPLKLVISARGVYSETLH